MRRRLAGLLLTAVLSQTAAAEPRRWHETLSPHFQVSHESAFAPQSFTLDLEKLHNRLRLDLSMFAPWMAKERIKLFLYADQSTFLRGRFNPPAWSNGLAFVQDRTLATFAMEDRAKLMQVLGHETTHLLFEGYFQEAGKVPPVWLNEGLSMMEEDGPAEAEGSQWKAAFEDLSPDEIMALPRFVALTPTKDLLDDNATVTLWYVQAYGLVRFLYKGRSRMQFFNFCAMLREGKSLDDALSKVYRLRGLAALEKEFRASMGRARPSARASLAVPSAPQKEPSRAVPRTLRPVDFGRGGYKSLVPDEKKP